MEPEDKGYEESVDHDTKFIICKECKYYLRYNSKKNECIGHYCIRLHKTKVICLVTGDISTTDIQVSCKTDRKDIYGCSVEGRYFEPR